MTAASTSESKPHPASCVHPWPHRERNSQATCPSCGAVCKRDEHGKIWFFSTADDRAAKDRPSRAPKRDGGDR